MTFPKLLSLVTIALFGFIAFAYVTKSEQSGTVISSAGEEIEISLAGEELEIKGSDKAELAFQNPSLTLNLAPLPEVDFVDYLFNKTGPHLPIVETIEYKSRVPWHKGRAAWVADYAGHFKTSRHFIARSLNGRPDYQRQDVANGDRFNVYVQDRDFHFLLVVDVSRTQMLLYYVDNEKDERVHLKTYPVGLGRRDEYSPSGLLTPLGRYGLGSNIAVYTANSKGVFRGERVSMRTIFGTRWIPFAKEIDNCTHPAKGFGIHGAPWDEGENGQQVENITSLGKFESDGCIRLSQKDVEELYAIIVTQPTEIDIVTRLEEAKLPGQERSVKEVLVR